MLPAQQVRKHSVLSAFNVHLHQSARARAPWKCAEPVKHTHTHTHDKDTTRERERERDRNAPGSAVKHTQTHNRYTRTERERTEKDTQTHTPGSVLSQSRTSTMSRVVKHRLPLLSMAMLDALPSLMACQGAEPPAAAPQSLLPAPDFWLGSE